MGATLHRVAHALLDLDCGIGADNRCKTCGILVNPYPRAWGHRWVLHYYAGDLMERGCSCCSNPTTRWRKRVFRWRWVANCYRWWIMRGPLLGMQVVIGGLDGMYDPWIEPTAALRQEESNA